MKCKIKRACGDARSLSSGQAGVTDRRLCLDFELRSVSRVSVCWIERFDGILGWVWGARMCRTWGTGRIACATGGVGDFCLDIDEEWDSVTHWGRRVRCSKFSELKTRGAGSAGGCETELMYG